MKFQLFVFTILISLLSCDSGAEPDVITTNQLAGIFEYLEKESIKEVQAFHSNILDCNSSSLTLKDIEKTIIELRTLTHQYLDSIKQISNRDDLQQLSDNYYFSIKQYKNVVTENELAGAHIDVVKLLLMNQLLINELRIRDDILSHIAIDC